MEYLAIGLLVLSIIVGAISLYIDIKKKGLRQTVIDLIVEAEENFEHGENQEKFSYVYSLVYAKLPKVLQIILTEEKVKIFVQIVFDEIKKVLDYTPKK